MKIFLYLLTSVRNGKADGVTVLGGNNHNYNHDQVLMAIEANDASHAAGALRIKIVDTFDRSSEGLPTIYHTSSYYPEGAARPTDNPEGYFYLWLRELVNDDYKTFPNLAQTINLRVIAPTFPQTVRP